MCKSNACQHEKETLIKEQDHRIQLDGMVCLVEGCGGKCVAKGMCKLCYLTAYRRAKGIVSRVAIALCKVDGCGRKHHAMGFCTNCHYAAKARAKGVKPKKYKGRPLIETHPDLAAELVDQTLAGKVTAGFNKKLRWKCKLGHEWDAVCNSRVYGVGCPYCGNQKLMPGFNDMATTHPRLAMELVGDATKVMAGVRKKLRWRCNLGHEWEAAGCSRVNGVGCPYCCNKKVFSGFNDIATTHPDLAAELVDQGLAGIVAAGTHKKLHWCCKLGHEYKAAGYHRIGGTGCPKCAESGYNPSKAGIFYLVCRPGQFKLGIMNIGTGRLDQHHRSGWAILDTIELSGELARSIETIAKRMLKKNGIPTGSKAFREKFDGYSEAWNSADLDVTSIDDLLKKLGTSFEAILAA